MLDVDSIVCAISRAGEGPKVPYKLSDDPGTAPPGQGSAAPPLAQSGGVVNDDHEIVEHAGMSVSAGAARAAPAQGASDRGPRWRLQERRGFGGVAATPRSQGGGRYANQIDVDAGGATGV